MASTTTTTKSKVVITPDTFAELSTVKQAEVVHNLYRGEEMNQKEIAEKVGVSVPQVSNLITIHDMPRSLKKFIEDGKLSGTLVLQVRRDYKEKSDDEIAEMLQEVYAQKGGAITRKDFIKSVNVHNSLSIMKKFLKKHNRNSVKKNEVSFEFASGLLNGKLDEKQIARFFGMTSH